MTTTETPIDDQRASEDYARYADAIATFGGTAQPYDVWLDHYRADYVTTRSTGEPNDQD